MAPLFIGFVQAGVPLGVAFSFPISAPMVNEVALALLFGLFGWRVALLYLGLGLTVAIVSGCVIGRLRMERHLEPWVHDMPRLQARAGDVPGRAAVAQWLATAPAGVAATSAPCCDTAAGRCC